MPIKRIFSITAVCAAAVLLTSGVVWAGSSSRTDPCARANTWVFFYKTAQYGPGAPQGPFYNAYQVDYGHIDQWGSPTYTYNPPGVTLTYKPAGTYGAKDFIETFSWKIPKRYIQHEAAGEWMQLSPRRQWAGSVLDNRARIFAIDTRQGNGTRNINYVNACFTDPNLPPSPDHSTTSTTSLPPTTVPDSTTSTTGPQSTTSTSIVNESSTTTTPTTVP